MGLLSGAVLTLAIPITIANTKNTPPNPLIPKGQKAPKTPLWGLPPRKRKRPLISHPGALMIFRVYKDVSFPFKRVPAEPACIHDPSKVRSECLVCRTLYTPTDLTLAISHAIR